MSIPFVPRRALLKSAFSSGSILLLGQLALGVPSASAQIATVGGLTISVVDDHGAPVQEATVTLERGGATMHTYTATRAGVVLISVLTPGRYAVLAEQFGYQPVRMRDIEVVGGGLTRVSIRLAVRPPPINSVEEQPSNGSIDGGAAGRTISGRDLRSFDRRTDIGGAAEQFSDADVPRHGRYGFLASGNGLVPGFSSLFVDGVHETLLRHPGIPGEPAAPYLFARDAMSQATFSGNAGNGAGPGTLGSLLGASTAQGGDRFRFRPWATFSGAKFGGASLDNPGDSNATSIQAGVIMSGSLKHDTASWFLRGDYQQLEQPTAAPFDAARAVADTSADLFAAVRSVASTLGSKDVSSWLAPTVRTWKGGSGSGRLDWHFGPSTLLAVRAGAASWTETNPLVGTELVSGAGSQLKASDFSTAAMLTTGADAWTSETRVGIRSSSRDWTGAALPYTGLVGDAIALGGARTLTGSFKENGFSVSEMFAYRLDNHTFQGGLSFDHRSVTDDWIPGSAGEFEFGGLATFAAGQGAFYQAIRSSAPASLGIKDLGIFVQDDWRLTPQLQLLLGIRADYEGLPTAAITNNPGWVHLTGVSNINQPVDAKNHDFGPRVGMTWDASGDGGTVLRGSVGLVPGQYDIAALAEVVQFDGDVSIRRATGALTWPQVGANAGTLVGPALTLFADSVRKPQSFKGDVSLTRRIDGATTLTLSGGYRHANYMLQRQDLNLAVGTSSTGSDGRPIYGALEQYGSLLTPKVGSNRRFGEYDMVYALSSTGYNNYTEASIALEHHLAHGIDLSLGYTYSKTTDNLPGSLSGNPADQLSPFPAGLNGARWEEGRSDLDIPHRVSATLSYATSSKSPFTLAARFRYRSGLPFTPGFRNGVDANGDGSGANDPAYITAAIPGAAALTGANSCLASQVGQFAVRNSCRESGVSSLDLRASLPISGGWAITIDGFNVVGTSTGLYDHAALLVDPKGTITTDATGHTVLPLVANPGFGQLLSRRGDPRTIRIGFRVEN